MLTMRNEFIYYPKRKMIKKFVYGNFKFKTGEFKDKVLIIPKTDAEKNADIIKNKKFLFKKINYLDKKEIDYLDKKEEIKEIDYLNKKEEKIFNPTTQMHGYGGIIWGEKLYISLHTTKKFSNIYGIEKENIEINDPENPIKNVNIIQIIDIKKDFNFFNISNPKKIGGMLRYGKMSEEEISVKIFSGFIESLKHSTSVIRFNSINSKSIEISEEDKLLIDPNGKIMMPAQSEMKITEEIDIPNLFEEINKELLMLQHDPNKRQELMKAAADNHLEWISKNLE